MSTVVIESKYGFYACSREEFAKLKEAHRLLLRAYQDCKRHLRWFNKQPENRRGPEPKAPAEFMEHGFHRLETRCFTGNGFMRCKDRRGVWQNYYLHVLAQYRLAKRPVATPEEVPVLDLPKNLDTMVATLTEFYAEQQCE